MDERISEIYFYENERWNEIVRSYSNYDVFYLNEYVVALMNENEKNGIPILLHYKNKDDNAINVVFVRDIAKDVKLKDHIEGNKYYDLISPYGYGGFIGNVTDYEALNDAYNAYCIEKGYICEFVRFELFTGYSSHYDGVVETRTHNVVRNLDNPVDELWTDFKQKVRKNVNKAVNNGLQIIIENTGEHIQEFLDIYYSTMNRCNAKDEYYFSKNFYEMLNRMEDNVTYFYVSYDGKIISSELVIYGSENSYSFLGGTYSDYFDLRPNDFLKYEIIKWAKEKGLKTFVLGGGYGSDDGIFQYKVGFAPNGIVNFYIGKKIFNKEVYDQLVSIRALDSPECVNSDFFPKYRA